MGWNTLGVDIYRFLAVPLPCTHPGSATLWHNLVWPVWPPFHLDSGHPGTPRSRTLVQSLRPLGPEVQFVLIWEVFADLGGVCQGKYRQVHPQCATRV